MKIFQPKILELKKGYSGKQAVSDIVAGLQKMPKYNELSGNAPHIV